jgi:hypothetical protein
MDPTGGTRPSGARLLAGLLHVDVVHQLSTVSSNVMLRVADAIDRGLPALERS